MSLEFTNTDKQDIHWSKTQVNVLINQFKDISNRLWQIVLLLLVEALGFLGVVVAILIKA